MARILIILCCESGFTWDTKINPVALLSVFVTIGLAIALFRLGNAVAKRTSIRSILIGHLEKIIEVSTKSHNLITRQSSVNSDTQTTLGIYADDMLRHMYLCAVGVDSAELSVSEDLLNAADTGCNSYRDHCTSLSVSDVVTDEFKDRERDLHYNLSETIEKLIFHIHNIK